MLYDPKWGKPETKPADVFSLEGLIAWLENQQTGKEYIWNGSNCLICQYLEAAGENKFTGYGKFPIEHRISVANPISGPSTFGAALERARAVAVSRPHHLPTGD